MLAIFKPLPISEIKRILKASLFSHIMIHVGTDNIPTTITPLPGTLDQSYQQDLPHGPVPRGGTGVSLAPWLQAPDDGIWIHLAQLGRTFSVPCRCCSPVKQPATGTDRCSDQMEQEEKGHRGTRATVHQRGPPGPSLLIPLLQVTARLLGGSQTLGAPRARFPPCLGNVTKTFSALETAGDHL